MTTFYSNGFTPEECRALFVVEQILPISMQQFIKAPTVEDLCVSGSITCIQGKLTTKKLPREKSWLWNQSRAPSKTKDVTGSINLQFNKFNTRKSTRTPNAPQPPRLKIWLFTLTYNTGEVCSVVWCEKGFPSVRNLSTKAPEQVEDNELSEDLSLSDLKFLRPFVSEDIAESLGWKLSFAEAEHESWGSFENSPTQCEVEQFFDSIFSL